MRTARLFTFGALLASLLLAACAPSATPVVPPVSPTPADNLPAASAPVDASPAASGALDGASWILVSLNGQPVNADSPITLNFDQGQLAGSDGCNQYSGPYTAASGQFSVGQGLASTMMACADPIMQQASAYTAALAQAAAYQSAGQRLELLDTGGHSLLVFQAQSQELGGTSWVVTAINNGQQAMVSVALGAPLTANFGADGRLSGSAGCNTYSADYQVTGSNVRFGPAAATRMMCAEPAGVMEQETQFLAALATAASFRLDGQQLELRTADGALAVSLVPAKTLRLPDAPLALDVPAIAQALPEANYPVEGTSAGWAQLTGGVFEEPAAPGSAAQTRVQLGDLQGFGDVNGDGAPDAAVTLAVDPGGSGTFVYLALVLDQKGVALPVASTLLGDRVQVQSIRIESAQISVRLLDHAPDQPLSAEPSLEVTRTFVWQAGQLVETK